MKFSSITAAGAVFGLAAATPIQKRSTIQKRQVPQEQSHGFILAGADEFMKLENTKNIVDSVFGLLGNAAAEEGAGDVTNLDCLKQETADQAFTNAKAISDIRGMALALMFQAIERNTGGVGVASVLCDEPTVNPEVGALTSHQDAASENGLAINKAITLELARQLASFGADPNLALLTGTFPPGDVNDNTGAGFTCDDEDRELGCIYTEGLLVLDATEEEIAAAVADVEQTFEGEGGILASDLVNLADFDVAVVEDEFDLSTIAPGSGAAADVDAGAGADAGVVDECEIIATPVAGVDAEVTPPAADVDAEVGGECSLVTVTVGADQTSAVMNQYPSAVIEDVETPAEGGAVATEVVEDVDDDEDVEDVVDEVEDGAEEIVEDDNQEENQEDIVDDNQDNVEEDVEQDAGAGAGGNLQTFAGALGGAAPEVVNNGGDRPFVVNGAAFDNERSALIRSCDIQNNQCFNAVNGGELAGGTEQCSAQLTECQASAGGAPGRKARRSIILGGGNASLLGGASAKVRGGAANRRVGGNRVVLGGNKAVLGGANALIGGNKAALGGLAGGKNLGSLVGGGNLGALLGGGIVGGIGGGIGAGQGGLVLPPSTGSQKLVAVVLEQCA